MQQQKSLTSAWQERLSALRNLPPVLTIVWDSGPLVVVLGFVFRLLAALQPVGLLYVSKLIIDTIVQVLSGHQPIPQRLWWLVVAEFIIAVLGNVLTRTIDYLDSPLADKYTRHVSIQVMKHAAELDVIAYEDPVFYDRLERARVRSWMAHHQGMGLLAIANLLDHGIVQQWFRRDARVQATELLLQERPVGHVAGKPKHKRPAAKRKPALRAA